MDSERLNELQYKHATDLILQTEKLIDMLIEADPEHLDHIARAYFIAAQDETTPEPLRAWYTRFSIMLRSAGEH